MVTSGSDRERKAVMPSRLSAMSAYRNHFYYDFGGQENYLYSKRAEKGKNVWPSATDGKLSRH